MKAIVIGALLFVAGCASSIMQSYVGKDVTEAAMDYGPPAGVMDLPDGRRAFMWNMTQSMTTPQTTNYSANAYGNWITGTATTYGGGTSTWQCTYTLIGQKNSKGSYTITSFRAPSMACE